MAASWRLMLAHWSETARAAAATAEEGSGSAAAETATVAVGSATMAVWARRRRAGKRRARRRSRRRRRGRRRRGQRRRGRGRQRHAYVPEPFTTPLVVPPAVALKVQAVFAARHVIGLAYFPVGVRHRRIRRAPHPRALGRSIGAANPHRIVSHSGDQQRVLRCGPHARQLLAGRHAGGLGIAP